MIKFLWKKKIALAEQLKFFGASKVDFISVYAKKPRILCKVKVNLNHFGMPSAAAIARQAIPVNITANPVNINTQNAQRQELFNAGMQNAQFAYLAQQDVRSMYRSMGQGAQMTGDAQYRNASAMGSASLIGVLGL